MSSAVKHFRRNQLALTQYQLSQLARQEGWLDSISILPTAWVVEPVGTCYWLDGLQMRHCDAGRPWPSGRRSDDAGTYGWLDESWKLKEAQGPSQKSIINILQIKILMNINCYINYLFQLHNITKLNSMAWLQHLCHMNCLATFHAPILGRCPVLGRRLGDCSLASVYFADLLF